MPQRGNGIQPRVERSDTLRTSIESMLNPNGVVAQGNAIVDATPLGLRILFTPDPRLRVPRNLGLKDGIPLGFKWHSAHNSP